MAQLRMFAGLKEISGFGRIEIEGETVAEVLSQAFDRFGENFEKLTERSRVWVNGEMADYAQTVSASDEIALLPPVSGG